MTREEQAQAMVGKTVKHRKKGFLYCVESADKDELYLKAMTKGARSTFKWVGRLEIDYEVVEPVSA